MKSYSHVNLLSFTLLIIHTIIIVQQDCCLTYGELLQVQIVHRHGARSHLSKNGLNAGLENGAQLLPLGVKQLKTLGELVRNRYLDSSSATTTKLRNGQVNYTSPLDVLSISTNLDRTLSSARAFLIGLYPQQHELIPTKTYGAKENDYRLRGYAICKKFIENQPISLETTKISAWKRSSKFINRIASAVNEKPTIANLFNIYDKYKLTSLGYPTPPGITPLSSSDMLKLKQLIDRIESQNYVFTDIAWFEPLLATLFNYSMEISKNFNTPSSTTHRIIEYSAHYPTLLSLVGIMHKKMSPIPPPSNVIPDFAAALLWETHRANDGSFFIRTFWYTGGGDPQLKEYSILPCTNCTLQHISRMFQLKLSVQPKRFCTACETNPRTSPICSNGALPSHINDNHQIGDVSPLVGVCTSARVSAGVLGGVLGIVFVLLIYALWHCIRIYRMRQERNRLARINSIQNSTENDPGWSSSMNKTFASGSITPSLE